MQDLFQVTPNLIPSEMRWQNYSDVLDTVPFLRFYANTIIVTVARVVGQVFLASLAAFAFSRLRFPGRDAPLLHPAGRVDGARAGADRSPTTS